MIRGLYIAASGMLTGARQTDQITNAIQNINTPGFRAELTTTRAFAGVTLRAQGGLLTPAALGGGSTRLGTGTVLESLGYDARPGALRRTGNPFDVALVGEGFLVVRDAEGLTRLTRDGHLRISADGLLVTSEGFAVLGTDDQPITVPGSDIAIREDGLVQANGTPAGTIQTATAPTEALLRAGNNTFILATGAQTEPAALLLRSGQLEDSNVNTTESLTAMVNVSRAYESAQRIFALQNQVLGRSVNDLGRF